MPAYVDDMENEALGVKVVSVFSCNKQQGLPIIHVAVLLLEANTGSPKGVVGGWRIDRYPYRSGIGRGYRPVSTFR